MHIYPSRKHLWKEHYINSVSSPGLINEKHPSRFWSQGDLSSNSSSITDQLHDLGLILLGLQFPYLWTMAVVFFLAMIIKIVTVKITTGFHKVLFLLIDIPLQASDQLNGLGITSLVTFLNLTPLEWATYNSLKQECHLFIHSSNHSSIHLFSHPSIHHSNIHPSKHASNFHPFILLSNSPSLFSSLPPFLPSLLSSSHSFLSHSIPSFFLQVHSFSSTPCLLCLESNSSPLVSKHR